MLCSPLLDDRLIGDDNSDTAVLEGVTIDEALGNERRKTEDALNLLRCDVLALGKLEDVLGPVDDLH